MILVVVCYGNTGINLKVQMIFLVNCMMIIMHG